MNDIRELSKALADFSRARDWEQFHSPKNLAMALSVESAELLEHFQWMTEEESRQPDAKITAAIADEIADVQIYLLMLANKLGVDPLAAAGSKLEKNRARYPVDVARGSPAKASRDLGEGS